MIGRLHHTVIDCPDPVALAQFYSKLLGLPVTYEDDDFSVVSANQESSGVAFQRSPGYLPPEWPDSTGSQQMHVDVMVEDVEAATPVVLDLGARMLSPDGVFADPAGHPFCLIPRPHWAPSLPGDD